MKSYILALATLAAMSFSGAAYAADATAPKAMSDSEMDKVTAGAGVGCDISGRCGPDALVVLRPATGVVNSGVFTNGTPGKGNDYSDDNAADIIIGTPGG